MSPIRSDATNNSDSSYLSAFAEANRPGFSFERPGCLLHGLGIGQRRPCGSFVQTAQAGRSCRSSPGSRTRMWPWASGQPGHAGQEDLAVQENLGGNSQRLFCRLPHPPWRALRSSFAPHLRHVNPVKQGSRYIDQPVHFTWLYSLRPPSTYALPPADCHGCKLTHRRQQLLSFLPQNPSRNRIHDRAAGFTFGNPLHHDIFTHGVIGCASKDRLPSSGADAGAPLSARAPMNHHSRI